MSSTMNLTQHYAPTKEVLLSAPTMSRMNLVPSPCFSEQGTSASHLAATKFLDAIANMMDCDGIDDDDTGAYTHVEHTREENYVFIPHDK